MRNVIQITVDHSFYFCISVGKLQIKTDYDQNSHFFKTCNSKLLQSNWTILPEGKPIEKPNKSHTGEQGLLTEVAEGILIRYGVGNHNAGDCQ